MLKGLIKATAPFVDRYADQIRISRENNQCYASKMLTRII